MKAMNRIDKFVIAINAVGMVFSTFAAIVNHQLYRPFWVGVFTTLAVLNAACIIILCRIGKKNNQS